MKRFMCAILVMLVMIPAFSLAETEGITVDDFTAWITSESDQSCSTSVSSVEGRTLFSASTEAQNVIQGFTFEGSNIIEYAQAKMKDETALYLKAYLTAFSDKGTFDEKLKDVRSAVDEKTADLFSAFSSSWSKKTQFGSYYLELSVSSAMELSIIWIHADSSIASKSDAMAMFADQYPTSETVKNTKVIEPTVQELAITKVRVYECYGYMRLQISAKNTSKDKTIDAFDIVARAYDTYGEKLPWYSYSLDYTNTFTEQPCKIKPKKSYKMGNTYWDLFGWDTAAKVEVAVSRYHTTDGDTVAVPESEYVWVSNK
jgi:hypothetical protein